MPGASLNYTENLLLEIEKGKPNFVIGKERKKRVKYYATINRLVKNGFLVKTGDKNTQALKLTPKGIIKTKRIKWRQFNLQKETRNNKKCVIVFDIPENIRKMRDLLRKCLYELGFKKIQKSVFIGPEKSLPYITELIKNCQIKEYVIVIKGKEISN